jgi:hypothetical protein
MDSRFEKHHTKNIDIPQFLGNIIPQVCYRVPVTYIEFDGGKLASRLNTRLLMGRLTRFFHSCQRFRSACGKNYIGSGLVSSQSGCIIDIDI